MTPRQATPAIISKMRQEDRKAMGFELPEEFSARVEAGEEKEFQADAIAYLRSAKGIRQIDVVANSRGNKAGVPDLIFCYAGRAVFLELKTSKGRTSTEQDQDHERRLLDGWAGCVVRSIPEIRAFLATFDLQTETKPGNTPVNQGETK